MYIGIIAAFVVGVLTFLCGLRYFVLLVTFYITGSRLTKYGAKIKKTLDTSYKEGGERGASQVLCCSLIGTVVCILYMYYVGENDYCISFEQNEIASILNCMYIAHYACCAGDTWVIYLFY